ncbi:MAG: chromosome segregation protein SMC, partial [Chloroflexota bacterium]
AAAGEAAQAEGRLREAEVALAEVDGAESASRARLADAERGIPVLRERLRQAEGRVRAAAVATVEARLGLDQVRDGLLVELAGLGRLGLLALGEGAVPAALPVGDEAAFAAELEAAVEGAMTAWAGGPAAEDPDAPSPARLSALRRRYLELGAENPFAAEEYAQVRERLEALEAQRADLEQAIESTHRLIAELSERIVEQFRATFAALEHAFARRFQSLFGGGEAQLVLTEPDDLAATGVEIMARPPGKKRQALAMLSGGERALTAVALLFAMLEVRPVPFCVLDEVDAALDEANVGRFTEALRDLTEATQFIVITHNRGTIEAADALYGVTIGDDAVSRIISLRLAEATALAGAAS